MRSRTRPNIGPVASPPPPPGKKSSRLDDVRVRDHEVRNPEEPVHADRKDRAHEHHEHQVVVLVHIARTGTSAFPLCC